VSSGGCNVIVVVGPSGLETPRLGVIHCFFGNHIDLKSNVIAAFRNLGWWSLQCLSDNFDRMLVVCVYNCSRLPRCVDIFTELPTTFFPYHLSSGSQSTAL
jgi:hypothetical protein